MRFCQSFMTELYRHLGEHTDVPAGDIGVGGREIGYLFGQYKRITNRYESGVLTGKGLAWGGSQVRTEATGYGAVFFADEMLATRGERWTAARGGLRLRQRRDLRHREGAAARRHAWSPARTPAATSSTRRASTWRCSRRSRRSSGARLNEYAERRRCGRARARWERLGGALRRGAALRDAERARRRAMPRRLVANGCMAVVGGARTCRPRRRRCGCFQEAGVAFAPGKAANAGGVATSALEMQQNASPRLLDLREYAEQRLRQIMRDIHARCLTTADEYGMPGNYVAGANIAGFAASPRRCSSSASSERVVMAR